MRVYHRTKNAFIRYRELEVLQFFEESSYFSLYLYEDDNDDELFCGMVDRRIKLSFISSQDQCWTHSNPNLNPRRIRCNGVLNDLFSSDDQGDRIARQQHLLCQPTKIIVLFLNLWRKPCSYMLRYIFINKQTFSYVYQSQYV